MLRNDEIIRQAGIIESIKVKHVKTAIKIKFFKQNGSSNYRKKIHNKKK